MAGSSWSSCVSDRRHLHGDVLHNLRVIEEGRVALFGDHKPADTLVGVATLSNPDYLIEVDAIAVIDEAGAQAPAKAVPVSAACAS